ncbi:hypothetical protein UFOVP185_39 [uncultured Caudovirales phage]|uniref:Uncharacterized protein n=1 Tax=uncultured Caudovirales phage TaxID=2100421 RepID=A0A6J7WGZ7_9CAUD|nr:hypothetical protein UFOVP185_39 [uncultured Caudovirales phage]
MNIYLDGEELNLSNIHLTQFENVFNQLVKDLPNMVEPDFSSIQKLKSQNKEMLEIAFQDTLNEFI